MSRSKGEGIINSSDVGSESSSGGSPIGSSMIGVSSRHKSEGAHKGMTLDADLDVDVNSASVDDESSGSSQEIKMAKEKSRTSHKQQQRPTKAHNDTYDEHEVRVGGKQRAHSGKRGNTNNNNNNKNNKNNKNNNQRKGDKINNMVMREEEYDGYNYNDSGDYEDGLGKGEKKKGKIRSKDFKLFGKFHGIICPTVNGMMSPVFILRIGYITGKLSILIITAMMILGYVLVGLSSHSFTAVVSNRYVNKQGISRAVFKSFSVDYGFMLLVFMFLLAIITLAVDCLCFGEGFASFIKPGGFTGSFRWNTVVIALFYLLVLCCVGTSRMKWTRHYIRPYFFILVVLCVAMFLIMALGTKEDGVDFWSISSSQDNFATNILSLGIAPRTFIEGFSLYLGAMIDIFPCEYNIDSHIKHPIRHSCTGIHIALYICLGMHMIISWTMGALVSSNKLIGDKYVLKTLLLHPAIYGVVLTIIDTFHSFNILYECIKTATSISQDMADFSSTRIQRFFKLITGTLGKRKIPVIPLVMIFMFAGIFICCCLLDELLRLLTYSRLFFYATMNYCIFRAFQMEALWKPKIKAKRWYFVITAILCVAAALFADVDVIYGICAIFIALLIIREIGKGNWKTSSEDYSFKESLKVLNSVECQRGTYKIARPHILCFSPQQHQERNVLRFASTISRNYGSVVRGKILIGDQALRFNEALVMRRRYESLAKSKKLNIFEEIGIGTSIRTALQQLMLGTGCGIYRVTDLMMPVTKAILKPKEESQGSSSTSTSELLTNTSGTYKMFNRASSGRTTDTSLFSKNYARVEGSHVAQNPELYTSEVGLAETITASDYLNAVVDCTKMRIGVSIVTNIDMLYSGFGGEKLRLKSRGKKVETLNGPFVDVYMLTEDIGNLMLPMLLAMEESRRYTLRIYIGLYGPVLESFLKEVNRLVKSEKINFIIEAIWPGAFQGRRQVGNSNTLKASTLDGKRKGTLAGYMDFSDPVDDEPNAEAEEYLYEIGQERFQKQAKPYGTREYPMIPIDEATKVKRAVQNVMLEDAQEFAASRGVGALSGSNVMGTAATSPGQDFGGSPAQFNDRPISERWNEKTQFMEQMGSVIKTVSFNADFVFIDLPYPDILVPAEMYMNWIFKLGGQEKIPVIMSRSYDSYRL